MWRDTMPVEETVKLFAEPSFNSVTCHAEGFQLLSAARRGRMVPDEQFRHHGRLVAGARSSSGVMQRRIRATDAQETLGPWLVSCSSFTTDVGGCGGQHTLTLPPTLERGDLAVDPRGLRGSGVFERTTALFRGMFVRVYWLRDQPCCVLVLYVAAIFENTFMVKSKEMILTKICPKMVKHTNKDGRARCSPMLGSLET